MTRVKKNEKRGVQPSTPKICPPTLSVVTLELDDPNQNANTMNENYVSSMENAVAKIVDEHESGKVSGVIITSAKKTFFAGGDLRDLLAIPLDEPAAAQDTTDRVTAPLRELETLGIPTVAAIAGSALGGGLEIALSCHRRKR